MSNPSHIFISLSSIFRRESAGTMSSIVLTANLSVATGEAATGTIAGGYSFGILFLFFKIIDIP